MRPRFYNGHASRWVSMFLAALLPTLCTLTCTWAQVPQQVLSGGSAKATIVDGTSSGLRSPAPSDSWQAPARTPSHLPDFPTQTNNNAFPVITASGTDPRSVQSTNFQDMPLRQASPSREPQTLDEPIPPGRAASVGNDRIPLEPPKKLSKDAGDRSSGTIQMMISMGSSLLIVIGLFLGVAWFYRKTVNTSLSGGLPKQVVSVVGRTPLAARQQLVLLRFGSKLVLVSMVQGEARTISEITDPLEVDQLVGQCESSRPDSITQSFRSVLNQGVMS